MHPEQSSLSSSSLEGIMSSVKEKDTFNSWVFLLILLQASATDVFIMIMDYNSVGYSG